MVEGEVGCVRLSFFKLLKEQQISEIDHSHSEDASFIENGYAVYLSSKPFTDNVTPQAESTFNRGSILYTNKGLYSVDISLVARIDKVVEDVQLLSFENIKDCFKAALENDPNISKKTSGSLQVFSLAITYSHIINAIDGSDLKDTIR